MPRATWIIEPSPDNVTTSSVYMFPQGLGNVTYEYDEEMEYGSFRGINIDVEWASKITEISIVIQTPKDTLKSVSIGEEGMYDYVNIIQGFTSLYELQIASTDTCQYQEGCPTCNTLYTREEVSSIGPTVMADLSSFDYENAGGEDRFGNKSTLPLRVYTRGYSSGSVYNLTITVPFVEEGMDVDMLFDQVGNSNINIKGNLNCREKDENHYSLQCVLNAYQPWGCSNCQNNLNIDGKILSGTFNVSEISGTEGTESYGIKASITESDGCDHFAPLYDYDMESFNCLDGDEAAKVSIDTTPLPCIADNGMLDCGSLPDDFSMCDVTNRLCRAPLPQRECPVKKKDDTPPMSSGAPSFIISPYILWTSSLFVLSKIL